MQRQQRVRVLWIALIGAIVLSAVIIPLWVTADSGQPAFTATLYSDVIRFEADGVASLRVTIYDLSENELWNSGLIMGDFVDWDRANAWGERLANGYYLYLAQGWDAGDTLILNKTGKVVLLPGDQVELKMAPTVPAPAAEDDGPFPWRESPIQLSPMAVDVNHSTESWAFQQVGIGTTDPTDLMHIYSASWNPNIRLETDRTSGNGYAVFHAITPDSSMFFGSYLDTYTTVPAYAGKTVIQAEGGNFAFSAYQPNHDIEFYAGGRTSSQLRMFVDGASGNIGIGTANATGKLTIEGSSGNLIACYPGSSRAAGAAVFRVEADGDVYADGTVYSQTTAVGSADVAERINVSEWVEAGDVVEIDPYHVGFFRKASGLYSRRVAGIISTSPGVILGNDIDPDTDKWDDNRPVLAIAGRVPVKVSTENGPIAVGDLLVSSSIPGIAMKGDPTDSIGAVVGKAMEPLESGEGVIMAQVTLR